MKYYYALYMSANLETKKEEILRKLEDGRLQYEKYVIALSKGEQNHLDIFNSVLLIQKTIAKDNLFVVGLASGYSEALELVEKITQEVYDNTKGTDIRGYILQRQKEYEEGNV